MSRRKQLDLEVYDSAKEPSVEFTPQAGVDFVVTPYIQDLTERSLAYLNIGYAIHLMGPAGTGKSTLAMHIASQLGRSCTLLHGDDEFKASDLLGRDTGYRRNSIVDNYVSSIVKTEESMSVVWTSNRLTTACQKGHTLIYDEFTRSPATANNPFLSILEEGILNLPSSGKEKGYIRVDPNFRAIFTSNPEEYVGVHKTQDALLDRMITLRLDYQDRETETAIVCAKSKRTREDAEAIVNIVRSLRQLLGGMNGPTVRSAIAIAKILDHRNCAVDPSQEIFRVTCGDVLYYHTSRHLGNAISHSQVDAIIQSLGLNADSSRVSATKENTHAIGRLLTDDHRRPISENEVVHTDVLQVPPPISQLPILSPTAGTSTSGLELISSTSSDMETLLLNQTDEFIDHLHTSISNGSKQSRSTAGDPSPNDFRSAGLNTASALQMLEAAVSKFPRPPADTTFSSTSISR